MFVSFSDVLWGKTHFRYWHFDRDWETQGSVDHIVPKSKGGQDSWTNLVYCDKKLNTINSNKSLQEANLKLIKTPKEPKGKPVCALYNIAQHNDWKHFII